MTKTLHKVFDPDWLAFWLAVIALVLSGIFGYTSNDRTLHADVAVLQEKATDEHARMDRIEDKIDTLVYFVTGVKPQPHPTEK